MLSEHRETYPMGAQHPDAEEGKLGTEPGVGEPAVVGHSSGIPALRSPAKYVASYKARIFDTPKFARAFSRARLE
jgi:hypothetical protein